MLNQPISASLPERDLKIVEALLRLSPDGPKVVTYEDVVVQAWKLYPDDFGLRGYAKEHPDASDIHKRLYNSLKSKGWVRTAGQKKFALTPIGWERATAHFGQPSSAGAVGPASASAGRAERTAELEIEHLEKSEAAKLFIQGRIDDILDTDFFDFYRTSVRAKPQEFESRLNTVEYALTEAERTRRANGEVLKELDNLLREKFKDYIALMVERRKRAGR